MPGRGQGPDITVEYTANSYEISNQDQAPEGIETKGTDFAIVAAPGGSMTRSFTIRNDGDSILTLSGQFPVTLVGGGSGHFQVTQPESLQLAPSQSTEFSVNFAPGLSAIRDGGSSDTAGVSAFQILSDGFSQGDGIYWIDPDGEGPGVPFRIHADMTRDGGGWALGLKTWYQAGHFKDPGAVGTVEDGLTLKGNPYKLSDADIRALIGPSLNTDVLADQAGYNSAYSTGNLEYVVLRNYTGSWTWEQLMPPSTNPTLLESYRISDGALAWRGELLIGSGVHSNGAGINASTVVRGPGTLIQLGTSSNSAWHHFYMGEHNSDTYLYLANGAQHSSGQAMNHRFWFRERVVNPNDQVFATVRIASDDPTDSTFDFRVAGKASPTNPSVISRIGTAASSIGDNSKVISAFPVEKGSYRTLLAFVFEEAGDLINGVSFGGMPMIPVAGETAPSGERVEIYALVLGSGQAIVGDVVVDSSAGNDSLAGAIAVAAFENVNQTNPFGTSAGDLGVQTRGGLTVAGSSGDLVAGVHFNAGQGDPPTLGGGIAPLHRLSSSLGNSPHFATFTKQGSANTHLDAWWNENQNFVTLALPLHAAELPPVLLNEVDALTQSGDSREFIELYDGGAGNTALDGLALVLFDGTTDTSYKAIDLDGESTDANGYFVIGNAGAPNVDLVIAGGTLQDGADAVALYTGDDTDFPTGTAVTTTNLIDALVYDSGQTDDTGLLPLLNASEPQLNEAEHGNAGGHSLQRLPNGSGGLRNTSAFSVLSPTPGAANTATPVPGAPDLTTSSDTGASTSDNLTNDATPTFSGTARAGAIMSVSSSVTGGVIGTGVADASGDWSVTVGSALADGVHQITTTADGSAASPALAITIDTTAPGAPTALDLLTANDSGISDSDNITSNDTPTIEGQAEADTTVTLNSSLDGDVGTGSANSLWSIATAVLQDGIHALTATASDAAGNESSESAALSLTIDTTRPTVTVNVAAGQDDPASSGPVEFTAVFSEAVAGFASGDVSTGGDAAGTVQVSGGASPFTISVGTTADEGFVSAAIPAGTVTDLAGNANHASTSTDNRVDLDAHDSGGGTPTSIPLSSGVGMFSGYLHPADTDVFSFTLTTYSIAHLFTTGTVDTRGVLRNGSGSLRNSPDADDDAGDGENFDTSAPLPAGDYTIAVSSDSGEGDYTLHVEATPTNDPAVLVAKARLIRQIKSLQKKLKKAKKKRDLKTVKKLKRRIRALQRKLRSL